MKKIAVICALLLFACHESVRDEGKIVVKEQESVWQPEKKQRGLQFISNVPSVIDGCQDACTYADTIMGNSKIIYITNKMDDAFIQADSNLIHLHRDTVNSKLISDNRFIEVFKNDSYKTILESEIFKEIGETYQYRGTLKIFKGDSLKYEVKVIGEGGC